MDVVLGWGFFLLLLGGCGTVGWLALRFLAQGSLARIALGLVLLVVAVVAPIFLVYGWALGVAAAVLGGLLATIQRFAGARWPKRLGLLAAVAFIGVEPLTSLQIANAQSAERVSRCQGNVAIQTIEGDRARYGRYPVSVHDMAVDSGDYEDPQCPIYQNVNWLYQQNAVRYEVGYWTDWLIAKDVCLHASQQPGWSCGFNRWGPFRPGETD